MLKGLLQEEERALTGMAQWIEHCPTKRKVAGLIPGQGTCWVVGQAPSWGHAGGN